MSGAMELENCSSELKDSYRSIYSLSRNIDEQKKKLTSINQLFGSDIEEKRIKLIQKCQELLFKCNNHLIGRKTREILWRKGYYEFIAFVKKNYHKEDKTANKTIEWTEKLRLFLLDGILNYKQIIIKLEKFYDLDLQLLVDFSIINDKNENETLNVDKENDKIQHESENVNHDDDDDDGINQKSLEAVGFALDTIHSSFLSLGDLHRYYIDFKFGDQKLPIKINKDLTALYYYQAFQLNPTIGMAQNQLGTLFYGQNYDLDSIYHYLYSLICTVPFDLSEPNVCKLFAAHAEYLEDLNPNKIEFNLRDFYAKFFLIVDIFFFDKNVPDFNNLCHCVLIDLRKILCSKTMNINEPSIFKIVCILLFCMSKLKMINSQKVYSLNAFLVAVCSDLIDSCIVNLEQFILSRSKQNEKFQEVYANAFNIFEANVRKSREEYKKFVGKEQTISNLVILKDKSKIVSNTTGRDVDDGRTLQKISQENDENKSLTNVISRNNKDIIATDEIMNTKTVTSMIKSSDDSQPKSTNSLSNKSNSNNSCKRKNAKLRRRRRKIARSDDDDDDESCSFDYSDSEFDTDFSSNDENEDYYDNDYDDASDLSSNFESDFSDIEENHNRKETDTEDYKNVISKNTGNQKNQQTLNEVNTFSDNEDVVIEEETIIYPNDPDSFNLIETFNHLSTINDVLHFKSENEDDTGIISSRPQSSIDDHMTMKLVINNDNNLKTDLQQQQQAAPIKLKYKNKYSKIDPNIIIEFALNENTVRALKVLFDWLRINNEILLGCYHTNPEFIHKIMKLLNYCNIDIFTRKVYFERDLIKTDNVRDKLDELFLIRSSIPLSEDVILKGLDLLKTTQSTLDWETSIRDHVTVNEENIMRIFKIVDFGFFICKFKKFKYNFCSKSRRFTENLQKKNRDKKKSSSSSAKRRERNRNRKSNYNSGNGGSRRMNNDTTSNCNRYGNVNRGRRNDYEKHRINVLDKNYGKSDEVKYQRQQQQEQSDNQVVTTVIPRKGYLRNRNQSVVEKSQQNQPQQLINGTYSDDNGSNNNVKQNEQKNDAEDKCRLMGRLWLKNEVETLEAELKQKPVNVVLTPFIVVDAKALTEFTRIVKDLVKSKQFIVLIPNAVLGELDQLKKQSDCARNAIRWLEQEFKVGNRHMRAQRDHESQPLLLIKIPKKLDRESSVFIQIAKFCNFIVTNHSDGGTDYEANLVTLLSGDNLNDKKSTNLCYTGILDAIPVRHDQISNFYEKFKKK